MQIAHGHIKAILAKVVVRRTGEYTQVIDQFQDSGIPLFDEADAKARGLCFKHNRGSPCDASCGYKHEHAKGRVKRPAAEPKAKSKAKARAKPMVKDVDKSSTPCPFKARGDCKWGEDCHYSHATLCLDLGMIATMVVADVSAPAVMKLPSPGKLRQSESGASRTVQDTGSANHLVSPKDLTQADLDDSVMESQPRTLQTANQQIKVDRRVLLQSLPLRQEVDPLILPDCPQVNSTGRLVIDNRFEFHWVPVGSNDSKAWYVTPDKSQVIECEVDTYVPFLDERESQPRAPDKVCKPHAYEPDTH